MIEQTELCWMALPITGLLSQIGGTWWKAARRYGIPIVMCATYVSFVGWSWWLILIAVLQWGMYCLPVTLKGDSIPDGGFINWAWLPVKYILASSPALILAPELWVIPIVTGSIMALMTVLSNLPKTANIFQWKLVEFFHGVAPMTVMCFVITLGGK